MEDYRLEMGVRIQTLRAMQHLSQEKLAEGLSVSVKHISEVERGIANLSMELFLKLANLLDCSLDYLVYGRTTDGIRSYVPEIIYEVYQNGSETDKLLLTEYLQLYRKIRTDQEKPDTKEKHPQK